MIFEFTPSAVSKTFNELSCALIVRPGRRKPFKKGLAVMGKILVLIA